MKKSTGRKHPHRTNGVTLVEYAKAKQLPINFLKGLGLGDVFIQSVPAVRIPYMREDGEEAAVRFRFSMDTAQQRFTWRKGSKPCPYGLQRLEGARKVGHITLVEGESDSQTLWMHGIPALGLPGANTWNEKWALHLDGINTIYVLLESDRGGAAMLKWLAHSAIRDRVRLVRLKSAKDPSELYLKNPKGFRKAWNQAISGSKPWSELQDAQTEKKVRSLRELCKSLAEHENILDRFGEAMVQRGVAGESRIAKLLYLAITSRLLDRIVSVATKGPSAAGKSFLEQSVLDFFPSSAYYALTAMSDKALAYSDEPLKHKMVVLYEASALRSEWADYFVRSLLSEGRLIYETVEKSPTGSLKVRRIEREGPTGLLTTTTAIALHPENETRCLSLRIDDSAYQTMQIMKMEASKVSGRAEQIPMSAEDFFRPWHALQDWLTASENRVVVPFASAVAVIVPPVAVRLRRDFPAVMSLIQAHALLHQETRQRDQQGRIIATLTDYDRVRVLIQPVLADAAERTVAKTLCQTVQVVEEILKSKRETSAPRSETAASIKEIAKKLRLDRSAASRRVHECIARGYLATEDEIKQGRPLRLVLGDPLPKNRALLPPPEEIEEYLEWIAVPLSRDDDD